MKIRSLLFSAFVLLILICPIHSQSSKGKISGIVIDKSSNSPIESADVTLFKTNDSALIKGIATDKEGRFEFSGIPLGSYTVRANFVGYNFVTVKGIVLSEKKPIVTLDPIKLTEGTASMEEILVEAEKSPIQFEGEKKIFNVSQNPMSQSGSLADLLKNIPSVSLDADGNVSLRGNSNVKITVDGRPFGMDGQNRSQLLEQIPANSIESIELITNPSSKYEAEGVSGIINIVLKKNKSFGYNGNLSLNAGTGDKYNGSFNINLKNDKIQVFSNYNYNIFSFKITGGSERTNSLSTIAREFTQDNLGNGRVNSHFVKGGIDYFIDSRNTLGLTATYQNSKRRRGELISTREFDVNNYLTSYFTRDYNGDTKGQTLDLALNYTLKFKTPQQTLTADAIYSLNKNEEDGFTIENDITPQTINPEQVKEFSKIKDQDFSFQSDYVHPTGEESKIEAGFKSRYRKKENDYSNQKFDYNLNQFTTDPNLTNNFEYNDIVNAVYAQYSGKLDIFSYQFGTRVEQTITKSKLLTNSQEFKNDYIDIFPSANISAKISKSNELQLSYSRRIHRPSLFTLNPFVNSADPNNYFSGNPNLRPEYTDSYEMSFIQYLPGTSLTPSVFYRHTKDLISRTREYIDSNTTLTSFVNYASSKSYGAELIFNSQPVQFWNINGSISYFKTDIDAANISSAFVNEGSTWSGRVSSSLFLPLQFSLQLSYFYSGDILAAQATIEPFHSFDAALRKDLFDGRLGLTLKVNDVFNTLRFKVNINNDVNFREILERKRDTRTVNFSLNYKFGVADKNQQKRRRDSNRENQGNDGFGF
ncbi:MAG: TonB-dependent receptor [Chlorobi bacterium]|nr:TonB-dependent receptor [Chlorobiota bacterium]MCI0716712.1 TonB-dependent receptor [Chlorobiota bacterium]